MSDYKYTTENFIINSIEINGKGVYDYSKTVCEKSKSNVILRCIKHNFEFSQTASNHLKGARCKKCGIESRIKKQTGNIDELKKKWNKTHKNKYCYDHVKYVNNRVKIEIECSIHGNFWQNPSNHDRGAGCAKCASKQSADNRRKSLEDFIKEANEKHKNKYDYSKVEYKKDSQKVCIICSVKDHGEFWQTPLSHIGQGCGCSKCAKRCSYDKKYWVKLARKVHGKKYSYDKVEFKKSTDKICITCVKHGNFWQRAISHSNQQHGCPRCYKRYSKSQIQWLNYLSVHNNNIKHAETENGEYRIPNTAYSADGYDAKTRTVYEYHGSFWHGDIRYYNPEDTNPVSKKKFGELLKSTLKKELLIRNLGYNYKCIWGADWINGVKAVTTLQRKWRMCKLSLKKK